MTGNLSRIGLAHGLPLLIGVGIGWLLGARLAATPPKESALPPIASSPEARGRILLNASQEVWLNATDRERHAAVAKVLR
jgi:hypothetical protein